MSNDTLQRLTETIEARRSAAPESSYVAKLFSKGDDAILKKVIEEAGEVLLAHKGLSASDVLQELARREGVSGIEEKAKRK